ncbi:retrovirus-related pol polyprotein from transposon TNT 1-94 [Tanacetum coccineum]
MVAQGYTQEEGIDYDEVFAPIARIEAIRLFLAYASFKDFMVYQMDVKSAFLYGKIEEEVYVCQPPGFEDPDFPDRVYKVEKALYGLHQAPRAWYETLSTYLLDNEFQRGKIDKTLFIKRYKGLQVQQKKDGIFISQDKYVGEILKKFRFTEVKTASTPMETQKPLLKDEDGEEVDVHMYRSMIGSLMYLTSSRPDIMFAVCACARYQVNPKVSHLYAVKRIFRYLKGQPKLGLWYPKDSPFDLVAYTDSDYAGASLDRKSTTGGCQFLGSRLISWQCKKQTVVANSIIEAEYVVCFKLLWIWVLDSIKLLLYLILLGKAKKSVKLMMEKLFRMELELMLVKTINGEVQLHALVNGKKIIITESTVRRDLQLEDVEGVDCLPNSTIFEQLALMGEAFNRRKDTQVPQSSDPSENVVDEAVHKQLGVWCQETIGDTTARTRFESVSKHSNDSLLVRGNTLQSDEDRLKLNELMELCTTLQKKVLDLEKTKTTQANEIYSLKRRVKKLEKKDRSRTHKLKRLYKVGLSARVESSGDEEDLGEDSSKQGRRINAIDVDEDITLVNVHNDADNEMFDVNVLNGEEPMKKKVQIMLDEEAALKLQAEFSEEERLAREKAKKEKEDNIALIEEWDDIQVKIDVDH